MSHVFHPSKKLRFYRRFDRWMIQVAQTPSCFFSPRASRVSNGQLRFNNTGAGVLRAPDSRCHSQKMHGTIHIVTAVVTIGRTTTCYMQCIRYRSNECTPDTGLQPSMKQCMMYGHIFRPGSRRMDTYYHDSLI